MHHYSFLGKVASNATGYPNFAATATIYSSYLKKWYLKQS
jgi:hypothetical protein